MTAIFANKVRKILHKKIKGYSNCWIQDDVLIADIQPLVDPIKLKGVPYFPIITYILVLVK